MREARRARQSGGHWRLAASGAPGAWRPPRHAAQSWNRSARPRSSPQAPRHRSPPLLASGSSLRATPRRAAADCRRAIYFTIYTDFHGCVFWDDVRDKRMTYCKQMYVGINFCIGILLEEQVCFARRACAAPAGVTTSFYVKTSTLLFSSTLWTTEKTTQTVNLP